MGEPTLRERITRAIDDKARLPIDQLIAATDALLPIVDAYAEQVRAAEREYIAKGIEKHGRRFPYGGVRRDALDVAVAIARLGGEQP